MAQVQALFSDPLRRGAWEAHQEYARGAVSVHFGLAENFYADWPAPTCIIADGPYGVSGFPGDAHTPAALADWYEPHVKAWNGRATPETTLWFWNTEAGWAAVHPCVESRQCSGATFCALSNKAARTIRSQPPWRN